MTIKPHFKRPNELRMVTILGQIWKEKYDLQLLKGIITRRKSLVSD